MSLDEFCWAQVYLYKLILFSMEPKKYFPWKHKNISRMLFFFIFYILHQQIFLIPIYNSNWRWNEAVTFLMIDIYLIYLDSSQVSNICFLLYHFRHHFSLYNLILVMKILGQWKNRFSNLRLFIWDDPEFGQYTHVVSRHKNK